MALTLTTNAPNFPFQVIAKDSDGTLGAPMPGGTIGKVTTEPAGVALVSLDPAPVPVANPFDPASGTASVISGVARPLAVGKTTATATVLNPDGSTLVEVTDTITVVDPADGTPAWEGILFGASRPVALPPPGTAAKSAAAASHNPSHKEPEKHKSHER